MTENKVFSKSYNLDSIAEKKLQSMLSKWKEWHYTFLYIKGFNKLFNRRLRKIDN